jgi:dipeptidyl aminopeptidase/acylaminoacyl peptidase
MQKALRETNGDVELLIVAGADHRFKGQQNAQAWSAVTKFLSLHLGYRQ